MKQEHCSIFEANDDLKLINPEKLTFLTRPDALLQLGFTLNELQQSDENN